MDHASLVFLPLIFVVSCGCLVKLVRIERLLDEVKHGMAGRGARSCSDATKRVPPKTPDDGAPGGGGA